MKPELEIKNRTLRYSNPKSIRRIDLPRRRIDEEKLRKIGERSSTRSFQIGFQFFN